MSHMGKSNFRHVIHMLPVWFAVTFLAPERHLLHVSVKDCLTCRLQMHSCVCRRRQSSEGLFGPYAGMPTARVLMFTCVTVAE